MWKNVKGSEEMLIPNCCGFLSAGDKYHGMGGKKVLFKGSEKDGAVVVGWGLVEQVLC